MLQTTSALHHQLEAYSMADDFQSFCFKNGDNLGSGMNGKFYFP